MNHETIEPVAIKLYGISPPDKHGWCSFFLLGLRPDGAVFWQIMSVQENSIKKHGFREYFASKFTNAIVAMSLKMARDNVSGADYLPFNHYHARLTEDGKNWEGYCDTE
jgi:hypothetical protein